MKVLLTAEAAKANDLYTIHALHIAEPRLIHAAAYAVLDALQTGEYDLRRPLILCGSGNNGADGFSLARMLGEQGAKVTVLYLGKALEKQAMSEQCYLHYEQAADAGVPAMTELPADLSAYTLVVDAIYGTGMRGAITSDKVCSVFDTINVSKLPVVAIDVPSGVNCTTGAADTHTLRAVQTVTVQQDKAGLLLYPGAEYAGKVTVADIGIEQDPTFTQAPVLAIEDSDLASLLPARPARSNKGTFGRVLIVGGAAGMAGAAYLAAMGAYRTGAGLVEILTHADNRVILQQLIPEAVLTCYADDNELHTAVDACLARADAVVLGCGLGLSDAAKCLVGQVLAKVRVPLVVDADALNIISQDPALLGSLDKEQKARTVITPHPAEAARLLGTGASVQEVVADMVTAADALCQKFGINLLLKDARTLLCAHDQSIRYVNLSGSTALAGAGSGDILAGMIGGLSAAKTNTLLTITTAALAAYLHGKAGESAAQKVGARAAMARDILDGLCK